MSPLEPWIVDGTPGSYSLTTTIFPNATIAQQVLCPCGQRPPYGPLEVRSSPSRDHGGVWRRARFPELHPRPGTTSRSISPNSQVTPFDCIIIPGERPRSACQSSPVCETPATDLMGSNNATPIPPLSGYVHVEPDQPKSSPNASRGRQALTGPALAVALSY